MGTVMPVRNALKDSGPLPVKGAVHGADGVHAGCTKGFARGYGKARPGTLWQDEGIHGSAPVEMFYCCTGSDGRIWGCPDQAERYEEECLRDRSFEEIWRGGFQRYRDLRVVREDGR